MSQCDVDGMIFDKPEQHEEIAKQMDKLNRNAAKIVTFEEIEFPGFNKNKLVDNVSFQKNEKEKKINFP